MNMMGTITRSVRKRKTFLTRCLKSPRAVPSTSFSTLAYEEVLPSTSAPSRTAFVLHGLLGCARNWRSFSRALASSLSSTSPSAKQWRMVLVDLRNHGRSAEINGFDPPNDMFNAAKDVANLVRTRGWGWPDAVIGHSMGGKVALQFAQSCARGDYGDSVILPRQDLETRLCFAGISNISLFKRGVGGRKKNKNKEEQLWVLDSVPGKVETDKSDGEVEKVLKTLQNLPSLIPSRKWLVNHMLELGFSKSLSEWIGSNLKKSGDHETWTFNLEGAIEMFHSYGETSYWSLLEHLPKGIEIAIVRAEKSDRWDSDVVQRLESLSSFKRDENDGKVSVHVLPNAGHWVHVDNPMGLQDVMAPKMASL